MMEKIRTAASSIIVKIIFAIIILAFIFTGVGGLFGSNTNSTDDERLYIAKVDGEGISRAGFEEDVNQEISKTIKLGFSNSTDDPEVRNKVFLSIVNNHLAYKLSDNLGMRISDDQVKSIITKQRVFFVDGSFNNEKYLSLLQQSGYTPDTYGEFLRAEQQKNQLLSSLFLTNFSLPIELELSKLTNQQRSGYYTEVNVNDIIDKSVVDVSEDEARQYYQNNEQSFLLNDRIKIKFILNDYGAAMREAKTPTEEELVNIYEKNRMDYTQPAKYEFDLISVDNEDKAKALNKELQQSGSFANVATSNNVINLGWFTESALPDYLQLDLVEKGNSTIANIDGSYYVVLLKDIQKRQILPLDFVKSKISSQLFLKRAQDIYDLKNEQLVAAREKYETLEEISDATGLDISEPEDWQIKGNPYSIISNQELSNYLFSDEMIKDGIPTGKVSNLVETTDPKLTYVIQVLDYQPKGIASYEEVYEQIAQNIRHQHATKIFSDSLNEIIDNLNKGAHDNRINFAQKYRLKRDSKDFDESTTNMIYSLIPPSKGKKVFGANIIDENSAIVAVLTTVENGEEVDISSELVNLQGYSIYEELNSYLRSNAKIEIMPNANL